MAVHVKSSSVYKTYYNTRNGYLANNFETKFGKKDKFQASSFTHMWVCSDTGGAHPRTEQVQTFRANTNTLREGHSLLHFGMVKAASGLEQAKAAPGQRCTGDMGRFDYEYYSNSAAADE